MEKHRALGKGLQALIPDIKQDISAVVGEATRGESIVYLKIDKIHTGKYQPRTDFNQARLEELVSSIKEKGVVQPILVRKRGSDYEVIAGERRLRAVKSLGITEIPAIIKDADDASAMELALIENIQREDLNPVEEAKAYQRLGSEFGFTQERIAQAVGRDRASVANILRLLNLPAKIQQFILDDLISMGHARALLGVSDLKKQMKLCEKIIRKGLSVREAEQLVKPHIAVRKASVYRTQDPHIKSLEEELQHVLGTRVRIIHGKKRGRLVIEYFSADDLNRIIGIIKKG